MPKLGLIVSVIELLSIIPPALCAQEGVTDEIPRDELEQLIEVVELLRDSQCHIRDLQQAVKDVRAHQRPSDMIAEIERRFFCSEADGTKGLAYELRQLGGLAKTVDRLRPEYTSTRMDEYLGKNSKIFEGASAIEANLELIASVRGADNMSGAERLSRMAKYVGAIEDAAGMIGAVNPVITAMVASYGKALQSASDVAKDVIEPRTRRVNEAIRAAGEAMGRMRQPGSLDPWSAGEVMEATDVLLAELRALQEDESRITQPDLTPFWDARDDAMRDRGISHVDLARLRGRNRRARHAIEDIARRLRGIEEWLDPTTAIIGGSYPELAAEKRAALAQAKVALANGTIHKLEVERLEEELAELEHRRELAEATARKLEERLPGELAVYDRTKVPLADLGADVRRRLEADAPGLLEHLPPQYEGGWYYLSASARRFLGDRLAKELKGLEDRRVDFAEKSRTFALNYGGRRSAQVTWTHTGHVDVFPQPHQRKLSFLIYGRFTIHHDYREDPLHPVMRDGGVYLHLMSHEVTVYFKNGRQTIRRFDKAPGTFAVTMLGVPLSVKVAVHYDGAATNSHDWEITWPIEP